MANQSESLWWIKLYCKCCSWLFGGVAGIKFHVKLYDLNLTKNIFSLPVQVNMNGVISFLTAVSQYTPDAFPLGDQRQIIAPFWSDVNTNNGGTISYRQSTDPVLRQRATNDVRRAFLDHQRFLATWIFIATWDRVAFHGASTSGKSKVKAWHYSDAD